MNIEIPPAQDSPKHILNVLNDDCIQSIFLQMENIRYFLSAAETCIRFQENAKLAFRNHYKKIRIGTLHVYISEHKRRTITLDRVQSFLSIFGHLIEELEFNRIAADQRLGDDVQNLIADYCGKTLKTFKLVSSYNSHINFSTRSPFKALEELKISDVNIYNFNYHSQLRRLKVSGSHTTELKWLIQSFPKLEMVNFSLLHQLQHNQAIRFLKLNPQLKSLTIDICKQIPQQVFENISSHTPNLEKLDFRGKSLNQNEPLIHISNLWYLNSLRIRLKDEIPAEILIDSLIENNVPIEILEIISELYDSTYSKLNVRQLKQLKKLKKTVPITYNR